MGRKHNFQSYFAWPGKNKDANRKVTIFLNVRRLVMTVEMVEIILILVTVVAAVVHYHPLKQGL